jgi:hypothetical protein
MSPEYLTHSLCRFQACLLNTSLQDKKLCQQNPELLDGWEPPANSKLSCLTFGDLDGKELQFPPGCDLRPYKRALCLQANLAIREARTHMEKDPESGWKTLEMTDFWSEEGSYVEKICAWLAESPPGYADDFFEFSASSSQTSGSSP